MSQNLYSLSLDSIKYILGLIRDTIDLPTTILDDLNIATNTTYSSYRLDTLLKALKDENIKYCDEAIAGLNKLSKEIVDDSSKVVKENTIYLILTNPVNNVYEQWLLINGTPQMIGTTEMNLDSVYTKQEADARYTLITDFDALKTKVDGKANATDLTTHTNDTNIHVTIAERTKWDKVDNKIDKTSILTAISASPSDNNLLSEKGIKSELDKKSNNTDLNNLSQGILVSETSMNENILLWDVGHYYFNLNTAWRKYKNIPSTEYAPHVYVTSVKPTKYKNVNLNSAEKTVWFRQIKVEGHLGKSFIRTIYTPDINDVINLEDGKLLSSGSDTGWQRVCTTSVNDVPLTKIVFSDTTYYEVYNPNITSYEVVNGICYLQADVKVVNKYLSYNKVLDGIPRPKSQQNGMASPWNSNNNNANLLFEIRDGSLFLAYGEPSQHHLINIAYPVAES